MLFNIKMSYYRKFKYESDSPNYDDLIVDTRHLYKADVEKIRMISLRILDVLEAICTKLDISYMLAYGSLLGCIRHKGFIPWDDDMDIMMSKNDFNIFLKHAYLLPESIEFQSGGKDFYKLIDKYSKVSNDQKRGVAVDIFIYEETKNKIYLYDTYSRDELIFENSCFFPIKSMRFEDGFRNCPQNYSKVLTAHYGDYLTLPPLDQQVFPHLKGKINIFPFKK